MSVTVSQSPGRYFKMCCLIDPSVHNPTILAVLDFPNVIWPNGSNHYSETCHFQVVVKCIHHFAEPFFHNVTAKNWLQSLALFLETWLNIECCTTTPSDYIGVYIIMLFTDDCAVLSEWEWHPNIENRYLAVSIDSVVDHNKYINVWETLDFVTMMAAQQRKTQSRNLTGVSLKTKWRLS